MRRLLSALALAALPAVTVGCGYGAGEPSRGVSLLVTRDFGARELGERRNVDPPGGETVMRLLQRHFDVKTRYGGGFVSSIAGVAGGQERGRPLDWFFFVNGVESERGAAAVALADGDRVWWDRRDWGAASSVAAVVGSFPEPLRDGARLRCARGAQAACAVAAARLRAAGVHATRAARLPRVLVGRWRALRGDPAAALLERGPSASGIYARPAADGRRITVLDERGRPAQVLGAGAGLVAATRRGSEQPTWIVTGTDGRGLLAAARALRARALGGRFALALAGDRGIRVPEAGGRG